MHRNRKQRSSAHERTAPSGWVSPMPTGPVMVDPSVPTAAELAGARATAREATRTAA